MSSTKLSRSLLKARRSHRPSGRQKPRSNTSGPLCKRLCNSPRSVRRTTSSSTDATGAPFAVLAQLQSDNEGSSSLTAMWIRNSVFRAVRGVSGSAARQVPQTFVYQHPSIRALSDYIYGVTTGRDLDTDAETVVQRKIAAMQEMVAKYSADFPMPRITTGVKPEQETVLVTGTTGRLGCHLLSQLIQDPAVRHVYALNRASARDGDQVAVLAARQRAAFEQWRLDAALLNNGKVTILPANYAEENIGLDAATYAEIEGSVTTIIHNGTLALGALPSAHHAYRRALQRGASTLTSASRASSRSLPAYAT
jgi:hypothetical protein